MGTEQEGGGRPRVREILTREELEGLAHDAGMSDEALGKLLGPLSGLGSGAMQMAMQAGDAFWSGRGLKTVKSQRLELQAAYPVAVRSLVFALTGLGREIKAAFDTAEGAYFETDLPGDIFSRGGTLQFDVIERGAGAVELLGASEIKGQIYDWGKGKRALAEVFDKTQGFARRLGG
jgi:hypothetical protein